MSQPNSYIQPGSHNKPSCHHKQTGFTLIELVLVMVLLGILGAVALPRFMGAGDSKSLTTRDALLSRLRLVQTMNMNEPLTQRTRLVVQQNGFAHITEPYDGTATSVGNASLTDTNQSWRRIYNTDANILLSGQILFSITFDRLGRPQAYNSGGGQISACDTSCDILIGTSNLNLTIEQEGYIHAQ